MGGGSSKRQTIGFRYYMSLHMGLCRGPIDELVQIKVGDLRAWPVPEEGRNTVVTIAEGPGGTGVLLRESGVVSTVPADQINTIRANGDYTIDAPELFGGDKKEGGVSGSLTMMRGHRTQIVDAWIKNLLGGRVPAFRGVATVFFNGLLTSMNPYPKKWSFRARRTMSGWDGDVWQPDLATIWMGDGTIKAMNGAHILYECLTNRAWARGMSRDLLLDSAWVEAAQTLFDEKFGLCLRWNRQTELSTFIQEVLDHIGGSIYPDRATGHLALSLIRADYDPATIPLFTYDNGLISIEDDDTASQEDLVNEVIVKWKNPIDNGDRSARVQNLAHYQSTGAPNSTTATYAGLPTVDLALRVAQRDLKAGATALKRYKVVLDRRAWKLVPGGVFRISVPEKGIYNAILRTGKVSEAGYADGRITAQAVLDVFGMPSSSFIVPEASEWTPPDRGVQVPSRRMVREVSYAELVGMLDPANLRILDNSATSIATLVGRPGSLMLAYELETQAEGEEEPTLGVGTFVPFVVSSAAISPYATSVPFTSPVDAGLIRVGSMVHINNEICRLDAIAMDSDGQGGTLTIRRGCVDTIPRSHGSNATIFFTDDSDDLGTDGREYATGEVVSVKVLPYTSSAKLSPALAPEDVVNLVGRQARPYPPANVRVDGSLVFNVSSVSGDVVLTWAHRNRVVQQDRLVGHLEASIAPEVGTTYRVRVYNGNTGSPVRTVDGIADTIWTYDTAMRGEDGITGEVWFELDSVRDSLGSHMRYRFGFPVS